MARFSRTEGSSRRKHWREQREPGSEVVNCRAELIVTSGFFTKAGEFLRNLSQRGYARSVVPLSNQAAQMVHFLQEPLVPA